MLVNQTLDNSTPCWKVWILIYFLMLSDICYSVSRSKQAPFRLLNHVFHEMGACMHGRGHGFSWMEVTKYFFPFRYYPCLSESQNRSYIWNMTFKFARCCRNLAVVRSSKYECDFEDMTHSWINPIFHNGEFNQRSFTNPNPSYQHSIFHP